MPKYTRIAPIEAFHLPSKWEGEDSFDMVGNSLQAFKLWAKKHGIRYVHHLVEGDPYWKVIVGGISPDLDPWVEVTLEHSNLLEVFPGEWIIKEYEGVFTSWSPDEFAKQYKPEKK